MSDPSQIHFGKIFLNFSTNKPVPHAKSNKYFGFFVSFFFKILVECDGAI